MSCLGDRLPRRSRTLGDIELPAHSAEGMAAFGGGAPRAGPDQVVDQRAWSWSDRSPAPHFWRRWSRRGLAATALHAAHASQMERIRHSSPPGAWSVRLDGPRAVCST